MLCFQIINTFQTHNDLLLIDVCTNLLSLWLSSHRAVTTARSRSVRLANVAGTPTRKLSPADSNRV